MKKPRNPTYHQKRRISKAELNWKEWLVECESGNELKLIHKKTGEHKTIGGTP